MVIIDTGVWLALSNRKDQFHERAKSRFLDLEKEGFITTWCVLTETCYLLQKRISRTAPDIFIQQIYASKTKIFDLSKDHLPRVIELTQKYINLPMDLADASLVILAEHLGHGRILSVDQRDFNTYRWNNTYPFQNLLL
ncbi:MAG: PIN domain-containing protein [Cyanobacteria bacterium WB6_1B_304]|jgi:predicted nucleic acid-binding protein|nr:PIN domain-containing protein [Cyanobacteria bacterium WB6_1B_304]